MSSNILVKSADMKGKDLQNASLKNADLVSAEMSGLVAVQADLTSADCTGARLDGANLTGARLESAVLDRASLRNANLSGAVAMRASFRSADLTAACLQGVDIGEADLTDAKLVDADLSDLLEGGCTLRTRLRDTNFGGADMQGAKMPAGYSFPSMGAAKDASAECTKILLILLIAVVHATLTLAATTDATLLPESSTFPLPVVQTVVSVLLFYTIAPLLLVVIFLYLQICLDQLSRRLRSVPVRLPDGARPLDGLPMSLVSFLIGHHGYNRTDSEDAIAMLARSISTGVLQVGPVVALGLFWLRYIPRHDLTLSLWHSLLFAVGVGIALLFSDIRRNLLARRLSGLPTRRALLMSAIIFASCVGVAIAASHSQLPMRLSWLAADITRAELSTKPDNWNGNDFSVVKGSRLRELNLRYVNGTFAFLAKADLERADLRGARLGNAELSEALLRGTLLADANLHRAVLTGAALDHANLRGTDLRGADLRLVDLFRADLDGADLRGANLEDAQFLEERQLSAALTDKTTILPSGASGPFIAGSQMEQAKNPIAIADSIHADDTK